MAQPKLTAVTWKDPQARKIVAVFDQAMKQDGSFYTVASWLLSGTSATVTTISAEDGLDRAVLTLSAELLAGLSITLVVDNSIQSLAGENLDAGFDTIVFTSQGEAPTIVSVVPFSTAKIDVTFNEAVSVATATVAGNYAVVSVDGTRSLSVVDATMTSSTVVRLTLSDEMTHDATYTLIVSDVADAAGNAISEATMDYAGLGVQPSVETGEYDDASGTIIIGFSRDMRKNNALGSRFSYTILTDHAGAAPVYVRSVRVLDARRVELSLSDATIGKDYKARVATSLVDDIGSAMNPEGNEFSFMGGGTTPTIAYVSAVGPNRVDVKFSKPLQNTEAIRNTATWVFTGGLTVLQASLSASDPSVVQLVTSDFIEGNEYDLTVSTS